MNEHNAFEQRLHRQPLRQVPAAWRDEILAQAEAAAGASPQRASMRQPLLATTAWLRVRELFWPCPQAWAGLAAAWIMIVALDLTLPGDALGPRAHRAEPPSREMRQLLMQQRQMLAELSGTVGTTEPDRSGATGPRPRSHFHNSLKTA